jgi:hypothetical protein
MITIPPIERTKKEELDLKIYLSSLHAAIGSDKCYLDQGQIVEFTRPVFTSANAKFYINNSENEYIWFSQLDRIVLQINDLGEYEGIALPLFPVNGEYKKIFDFSPDNFWDEVRGKKYKVITATQSVVLNVRGKTIKERGFRKLSEALEYVIKCLAESRIEDLGDLLRFANVYGFERIQ